MRKARLVSTVLWPLPYTLLGLAIGTLGLLTGGRVQWRSPAIEFHGGLVTRLVRRLPGGPRMVAITLGHTILGQTAEVLDIARAHESVHVRQYQRWGLLFGPAYLGCSLWLWLSGKDAYRDNPFEREAYAHSDPRF